MEKTAALAEGLEEAHQQGLVHRDVKPSNILLDSGGRYVLVDFGLVRDVTAETITRSGEMVGTLNYMSPEQVSRQRVDARSDIYSLGATLYEAVTLRMPFGGESDQAVQSAILFAELTLPRKLNPKLNRDLETIVVHALEKNPERRYSTAGEMAEDLRRWLQGEPPRHAKPQSALTRIARRTWRRVGTWT